MLESTHLACVHTSGVTFFGGCCCIKSVTHICLITTLCDSRAKAAYSMQASHQRSLARLVAHVMISPFSSATFPMVFAQLIRKPVDTYAQHGMQCRCMQKQLLSYAHMLPAGVRSDWQQHGNGVHSCQPCQSCSYLIASYAHTLMQSLTVRHEANSLRSIKAAPSGCAFTLVMHGAVAQSYLLFLDCFCLTAAHAHAANALPT